MSFMKKIEQFIRENDNFLVAGHRNADGDAIASSLAISLLLKKLNKKYRLIFHDKVIDKRFSFLEDSEKIQSIATFSEDFEIKSAIICDTPSFERLGDVSKLLPLKKKILKIDHHPTEEHFAEIDWTDENSSSTTCLVYQILEHFNFEFNKNSAQIILTGIMYDTGRFSYRNTKAIDFEISAKMLRFGADVEKSYVQIFCENPLSATRTIGIGLKKMETFFNNQVGLIYLNLKETLGSKSGEIEELSSLTTSVEGTHVGFFIREPEENIIKISFRSRGDINVNEIAAHFGGGGHTKAAGCRITNREYKDIKEELLTITEKYLKTYGYL
jgi:phosphoesterase RecJ-like protein